jgi:hypothetical protein
MVRGLVVSYRQSFPPFDESQSVPALALVDPTLSSRRLPHLEHSATPMASVSSSELEKCITQRASRQWGRPQVVMPALYTPVGAPQSERGAGTRIPVRRSRLYGVVRGDGLQLRVGPGPGQPICGIMVV